MASGQTWVELENLALHHHDGRSKATLRGALVAISMALTIGLVVLSTPSGTGQDPAMTASVVERAALSPTDARPAAVAADQPGPPPTAPAPPLAVTGLGQPPLPGHQIAEIAPNYAAAANTDIFHLVQRPSNWQPDRTHPVIVEYAPNRWPRFGLDGTQKDARMGSALSQGRDYLWIVLPFIDSKGTESLADDTYQTEWWGHGPGNGDVGATVDYVKDHLHGIIDQHGGDPDDVTLVGFSRGAIATNFVGLADDEIAGYWSAFYAAEHYDGVNTAWDYGGAGRADALRRLARLNGRPQLVAYLDQGITGEVRPYLERELPAGQVTFLPLSIDFLARHQVPGGNPSHHVDWMQADNDEIRQVRAWLRSGGDTATPPPVTSGPTTTEETNPSTTTTAGPTSTSTTETTPAVDTTQTSTTTPPSTTATTIAPTTGPTTTPPQSTTVPTTVSTTRPGGPIGDGVYLIRSTASGRCVDVPPPADTDGTAIHLWRCAPSLNRQQWRFEAAGDGSVRIASLNSGKVIDLDEPAEVNGSVIRVWADRGLSRQRWYVVPVGDGSYRLDAASGSWKTMTVSGTSDGSTILGWGIDPGGLDRQHWEIIPVG